MYNAGPTAVLIAAAAKNKIIRVFRQQGALSPQSAIEPENYGLKRRLIFNSLLRQGVLSAAAKDHFYLNEAGEQVMLKRRRKTVMIMVWLLVTALLVILVLVNR